MTVTLSLTNPKRPLAERFGRALDDAMRKRGVGSRPLAEAIGCSRLSITNYRRGHSLPRIETTRRMAAALNAPGLVGLNERLRAKTCDTCGATFHDETGGFNRRFCSEGCLKVKAKMRYGVPVAKRAAVAERRLKAHVEAVAAFCADCEPEGHCVTPECPLRAVSPLPLVPSVDVLPTRVPAS